MSEQHRDSASLRAIQPRIAVFVAASLLFFFVPAQAQDDLRLNGFYFTSPLELSGGYDSHFLAGTQQLSGYESLLTGPTWTWFRNTHRTDFTLDYQPEFEIFPEYSRLNAWNHNSRMRLDHRLNARWSLVGGNDLIATSDPLRTLGDSLVLLPRGRYVSDRGYTGLKYRMDLATTITIRIDGAVNTMQLAGPLKGELDYAAVAPSITLDRTLTKSQSISATYSFLYLSPFHPEVSGSPTGVHVVNGVYAIGVGKGFTFRLAGGFVEGSESALTGGVTVEKTLGQLWMSTGYERYVGFYGGLSQQPGVPVDQMPVAGGATPGSVYQVISARAKGPVWKRFSIEAAAQKATDAGGLYTQGINSLTGQLRVNYKLTDRLSLFARADYYGQNMNRFINAPITERGYFCGFDVTVARDPRFREQNTRHKTAPQDSTDAPAEVPDNQSQPVGGIVK